jgi:hypothetical protein
MSTVAELEGEIGLDVNPFVSATRVASTAFVDLEGKLSASANKVKQAMDGAFVDGQGRWRAASGRFLSDAEKAAAGIKNTESAFAKFGTTLKSAGANLEKVGTSLSIGLTAPLLDVGFDYEKSMNTFQAVTRASSNEMAAAARMAEKLGSDMSLPATSAAGAALAMTELAKGGLSAAQAMDAAKGSLQLAAAAQVDGARAAEITANALNIFGLAATDAGRVADILAATANAASGGVNDMALALKQSGRWRKRAYWEVMQVHR